MKIVLIMAAILPLVSCTKGMHKEPNVELIQDMMQQMPLKAQDAELTDANKGSVRLPPQGTVPKGYVPYPYHLDLAAAEKGLKNPIAGDFSPAVLQQGQKKYEVYCAVCHGVHGGGDGPVSVKMAVKPPALATDPTMQAYNDARIFHTISDGKGVMSAYAFQLANERDRWAVVNYVRNLQKMAKR